MASNNFDFIKNCVDSVNDNLRFFDLDDFSNYAISKAFTIKSFRTVMPTIKKVIISDPAVVIYWSDNTKTVSKCMKCDTFDPEVGLAMAISRKFYQSQGTDFPRKAFRNEIENAKKYS